MWWTLLARHWRPIAYALASLSLVLALVGLYSAVYSKGEQAERARWEQREAERRLAEARLRARLTQDGGELASRLHEAELRLADTRRRLDREITAAARRDHECLSAGLRLRLSRPAGLDPGLAAAGAAAPDAAVAAADPGGSSSEAAVAGWIADAMTLYSTCAARLAALIDWHERAASTSTQGPTP